MMNLYLNLMYANADQEQLDRIAGTINSLEPNGHAADVIMALQSVRTINVATIRNAEARNPNDALIIEAALLQSIFTGDKIQIENYAVKLTSMQKVSPSLLAYGYNQLMSVADDAILIVEGDLMVETLTILQWVYQIRKDVKCISLTNLGSEFYANEITKALNLKTNLLAKSDLEKSQVCKRLPIENPTQKFYYSISIPAKFLDSISENTYVVGLASHFSQTKFDNLAAIRDNLESKYLLNYLLVDFTGEPVYGSGKVFELNYLPAMIIHYNELKKAGLKTEEAELRELIERIARRNNREEIVARLLKDATPVSIPFTRLAIDGKKTEGQFRKVFKNVFANESEVTNEQYNVFLAYLQSSKLDELYKKYQFDFTGLEEPALGFMKNYSRAMVPTKKDRFFTQYPAVYVSYEAAEAYCQWLTDQYNNVPERKYKKVVFRLPTKKEWQLAALGIENPVSWELKENKSNVKVFPNDQEFGKNFMIKEVTLDEPDLLYPWFKFYNYRNRALNNKGCSLGNFKWPDDQKPCQPAKMTSVDGFALMAGVKSYFPNDIGLYDMVGNVAEILKEEGNAAGGSWNHSPEESTVQSILEYKKPSSEIGFRVFMEVIEF